MMACTCVHMYIPFTLRVLFTHQSEGCICICILVLVHVCVNVYIYMYMYKI